MKSLTLITSFILSLTIIGQSTDCEKHSLFIKGDSVYVWKNNSVKMMETASPNASVVTEINFGEKLVVLEAINVSSHYLEEQIKCYYDTLILEPLIVLKSPFIKVRFGNSEGYIFTHNLDKKNPRHHLNSKITDTLYIEKKCSPSTHGWENDSKTISNNGEITFRYDMATCYFNPHINKYNYYHIALKMIEEYNNNKDVSFTFSFSEKEYSYSFAWETKELIGGGRIEIYFNYFGMIRWDYDYGC